MGKLKQVQTDDAPQAIGPYSQAIIVGDMVYTAGQIALDPRTKDITGDEVVAQTEQVMKNLAAILEAAGTSLQGVVKTTVFLSDMGDFAAMNEVYAKHFGDHKPARSTVQAAGLPRNVKVEIEAIARVG
ncbi:MAG TPA: RidA family protein [Longimicrobiales bacterium]|nr:RidA family protein [Longimicrobiales bacterium]